LEIINRLVQGYAEKYSAEEDLLLKEISDHTYATHSNAIMLSGHLQGKLLELISKIIEPKNVLEIGTFAGYSALCLAAGLQEEGVLHTIEISEEEASIAASNFARSKIGHKIILHIGNALKVIPELEELWDLVFIDADKPNYIEYYKLVLPNVKSGGVILADNVLFHGEVLETPVSGKNAKSIHAFNEYVRQDTSVECVLLTIRDGLLLIRKK
jgi:predicted O-methyltransferase YrrM